MNENFRGCRLAIKLFEVIKLELVLQEMCTNVDAHISKDCLKTNLEELTNKIKTYENFCLFLWDNLISKLLYD